MAELGPLIDGEAIVRPGKFAVMLVRDRRFVVEHQIPRRLASFLAVWHATQLRARIGLMSRWIFRRSADRS